MILPGTGRGTATRSGVVEGGFPKRYRLREPSSVALSSPRPCTPAGSFLGERAFDHVVARLAHPRRHLEPALV